MRLKLSALLGAAVMLISGHACAADALEQSGGAPATVLPRVEVSALRDPVEKSYRKIVRGMDLFERKHSLALVNGRRREVLSIDKLYAGISRNPMTASELQHCDCEVLVDRTYYAPLGDRGWPDDTLLELEYMDNAASVGAGYAPGTPPR